MPSCLFCANAVCYPAEYEFIVNLKACVGAVLYYMQMHCVHVLCYPAGRCVIPVLLRLSQRLWEIW